MRNLLDTLYLLESTGLAGRKLGDVFSSDSAKLTFTNITFYPESGRFMPDELVEKLDSLEIPVNWQNKQTNKTGGFAIVELVDESDNKVYVGRFLDSIKANRTDNYVPNTFIINDETFKFGGKAAIKTQSMLTPQDLLKTQLNDNTIPSIMQQLAAEMGTDHPLYAIAHKVATGEELPIIFDAPPNISFTGFRDYFCEILQPMALQNDLYTGNAGEAAAKFLDGSFAETTISFDASKTAGLSDSILTLSDGRHVKVSSKGKQGATASVKNLMDGVNELRKTKEGNKLLTKFADSIEILEQIVSGGQANAPLNLAVKFNIIDENDAKTIQQLKNTASISIRNIKSLGLSKTLVSLALERETADKDQVNIYYHLIAAVAHKVAEYVNEKTTFSKAATAILNNGALIQVYTNAVERKNKWVLTSFDTVYPGNTINGVFLSASKNYMSTNIKGNFTFKIDRGLGIPKEAEPDPTKTNVKTDNDFVDAAAEIIRPKRKRDKEIGVGREKR